MFFTNYVRSHFFTRVSSVLGFYSEATTLDSESSKDGRVPN